MQSIIEKTVREIALENPSSIRVFESVGIDYCCGGGRQLSAACSRAGVDIGNLLELLDRAPNAGEAESKSWSEKSLTELIRHIIEVHHAYVRRETPRIAALFTKVVSKHGPAHPEVIELATLFQATAQELSTHLLKEEQVLFPWIEQMEEAVESGDQVPRPCFETLDRPIRNLVDEHEDAGALLAKMRSLSVGYTPPAGACPTFVGLYRGLEEFERDLHQHIHLENNILFPRAIHVEQGR